MKKVFLLVLALSILTVCATAQVTVTLDGDPISFDGAKPFQFEDRRVMVPADTFFNAIGFSTSKDDDTDTFLAIGGNGEDGFRNVMMQADNSGLYFFDTNAQTDAVPMIVEGVFYAPIRIIAEGLGYLVTWDEATKTVSLTVK